MAKNDNLTDFLADVANAIRDKKGTTDLINPQDFSAEIASIETGGSGESGGGGAAVVEKDVNFRDYDGTLLHSYTKSQFLALTELPELPIQKGLICQRWNWSLADAQTHVARTGKLQIGANYITEDGKTRLYISVTNSIKKTVSLYFSQTISKGVAIDWGDGSDVQSIEGTGVLNVNHDYAYKGDYCIILDVAEGCSLSLGDTSNGVMGRADKAGCGMLKNARIGKSVTLDNWAFYGCQALLSVSIPEGTIFGQVSFMYCYSLRAIIIPHGAVKIFESFCNSCYSLVVVSIPQGVKEIASSAFSYCSALPSIDIPQGVTKIDSSAFGYNTALTSCVIPDSVSSLGSSAFIQNKSLSEFSIPNMVTSVGSKTFSQCESLTKVILPQGVKSIASQAFYFCYSLVLLDFRLSASVPSLEKTNAFSSIPADGKIIVPDALYDSWIAATNWSTYASQIVKASEYTE